MVLDFKSQFILERISLLLLTTWASIQIYLFISFWDVSRRWDTYISDFFGIALKPDELLWIYDRHLENRLTCYSLLGSRDDQLPR